MRITVCFFARLREIAGQPRVSVEVPDGSSVDAVWKHLIESTPALAPHRAALAVAVDEEFARFTTPLRDGQVVALLPPVSGG
jgi:molybdopterin converting factor subunit 1